jgi:membrane-bound lytic murein transglycosylase D
MRSSPALLLIAAGLGACAPSRPQAVAPVAPPSPASVASVAPTSPVDSRPAAVAAAPAPARPLSRADQDTLKEQAFLDSLHLMAADTTRHAPTAPVAAEVVRAEAATLFGRPASGPAATTYDIDVATYASHERVQYWVDFFTGRARWHFERYLERLGRYDSLLRAELSAGGMPQDMIYLAMIESGFNHLARSRVGAVGMWQFMPSTARRYGLTVDAWVDERRDPYIETRAAIGYLTEMNSRFGSWYLAAAAYDAGPGKIQKGLDRGDYGALNGNDAYFAMAEGTFLRRETRDYVPKLIAAALIAKEPARYGFTGLEVWTPLRWDSVQVRFAVGLDVVARLARASAGDIEELNPAYLRGITPPDRTSWVRVPPGTADSVSARLATLPEKDRVTIITHLVGRGETLAKISRRYGVTIGDLKSANHLRSNALVRGQRLVIPASLSRGWRRAIASSSVEQDPPRRGRAARGARRSATRTPAGASVRGTTRSPTTRTASTSRRMHVVRNGENLSVIAHQFHTTSAALMQANGLGARSTLRVGQSIRIP